MKPWNAIRRALALPRVRGQVDRVRALVLAGRAREALPHARAAEKLARDRLRPDDPERILAIAYLATALHPSGESEAALRLYDEIENDARRVLGEVDDEYVAILNNIAVLSAPGDPDRAAACMVAVIDAKRKVHGPHTPHHLPNLQDLAHFLARRGEYAAAVPHFRELAETVRVLAGEEHPDYLQALENLEHALQDAGSAEEVEKPAAPQVDEDEAWAAYVAADWERARCLHRTMMARQPALPPPLELAVSLDPLVARACELDKQGVELEDAGDLAGAEGVYRVVLEVFSTSLPSDHPDLARASSNLGENLRKQHRYDEALTYHRTAIAALPDDEEIRRNLAVVFTSRCEHEGLEPRAYVERVLRKVWKEKADGYARSLRIRFPDRERGFVEQALHELNASAIFLESAGDPQRAAQVRTYAEKLAAIVYGPDSDSTVDLRLGTAQMLLRSGDLDGAERRIAGATGADAEWLRGRLAAALGDDERAERHLLRARELGCPPELVDEDIAIVRARTGTLDPCVETLREAAGRGAVRWQQDSLAACLMAAGEVEEAESLLLSVLEKRRAALGEWDPKYALAASNYGTLLRTTGRPAEAEPYFRATIAAREKHFGAGHTGVIEARARLALTLAALDRPDEALEQLIAAFDAGDTLIAEVSAFAHDRQRLTFLRNQRRLLDLALSITDDAEQAFGLVLRRKLVATETLVAKQQAMLGGRHPELAGLLDERNELARALTQAQLGDTFVNAEMIDDARTRLEELERTLARDVPELGRVDVSVADVRAALPAGFALVEFVRFTPDNADPRFVAFVLRADVLAMIPLGDARAIEEARRAGVGLRELVFDPLRAHLDEAEVILLAPDGDLNLVAFDALPDGDGYLIDRYRFHFLGTGRDLLRLAERPVAGTAPVLVAAAPDFGGSGDFEALPGAAEEGRAVAGIWPEARLWTGADARASRLRAERAPVILHLATHGFFLEHPDPMLASGLALAGANDGPEGILAAADVATLDLSGTQLVVLSACETAVGAPEPGEGVHGLRRAFQVAGARTVVMSQWAVPDEETRELMVGFHEGLRAGRPRSEALRDAKLALRGRGAEPLAWGAFVAEGDWRPLQ